MNYVIFASFGNDSIALIQWAHEQKLEGVTVLFNDTKWASTEWPHRVKSCQKWVETLGFTNATTSSIGMERLVAQKKGWPRQGIQFCTVELKIKPAIGWLEVNDPDKKLTCLTGVRRAESSNRKDAAEFIESSPNHGDRKLWQPLVHHTDAMRDELINRAGFKPLPHRSMECFPCINSNREDLRLLAQDESRIAHIESMETAMGFTSKGKPRTMFRPYRYMGATGIREIVRWALSERGKFSLDDGTGSGCDSGFCGI